MPHFLARLNQRGIDMQDAIRALHNGKLKEVDRDAENHQWKCTIVGRDVEGEDVTVVCALDDDEDKITLITVY